MRIRTRLVLCTLVCTFGPRLKAQRLRPDFTLTLPAPSEPHGNTELSTDSQDHLIFFETSGSGDWKLKRIVLHDHAHPTLRAIKVRGFAKPPNGSVYTSFSHATGTHFDVAAISVDEHTNRNAPPTESYVTVLNHNPWKIVNEHHFRGEDNFGNFGFFPGYFITLRANPDGVSNRFRAFTFPDFKFTAECTPDPNSTKIITTDCANFIKAIGAVDFKDVMDSINGVGRGSHAPPAPLAPRPGCESVQRSTDGRFEAYGCPSPNRPTDLPQENRYEIWDMSANHRVGVVISHGNFSTMFGLLPAGRATYFFQIVHGNRLRLYLCRPQPHRPTPGRH